MTLGHRIFVKPRRKPQFFMRKISQPKNRVFFVSYDDLKFFVITFGGNFSKKSAGQLHFVYSSGGIC